MRALLSRGPSTCIIAEIKQASPSAGVIRKRFDPVALVAPLQQRVQLGGVAQDVLGLADVLDPLLGTLRVAGGGLGRDRGRDAREGEGQRCGAEGASVHGVCVDRGGLCGRTIIERKLVPIGHRGDTG